MFNYHNTRSYYNFNDIGIRPHRYDVLLDFVAQNINKTFTRRELLFNSGYLGKEKTKMFNSGYMCYLTTDLNYTGILEYDRKTRRWKAGPNFTYVYGLKTIRELNR